MEILSPFLKPCEGYDKSFEVEPFILIVFGGGGDLTKKKIIPSLINLYEKKIIKKFQILSLSRTKRTIEEYHNMLYDELKKRYGRKLTKKGFDKFKKHLRYKSFDMLEKEDYTYLCDYISRQKKLLKTDNFLYYFATPPKIVPKAIEFLGFHSLCRDIKNSKIIVEKPFGDDKASAKKLNNKILKYFDEEQIYRIDHYLGKETVQNIMFFRFANAIFEPLWNRNHIDHIQITTSEDRGVSSRGEYYEQSGIVRDFVQNHILQLISLIAMEPPVGLEPELMRDARQKVLKSIRRYKPNEVGENSVIGQYAKGEVEGEKVVGYREEEKVLKNSKTPTFFAGKFFVDNWRWGGVPFYVRSGIRLKKRVSEILVVFKKPPLRLLGQTCSVINSNTCAFSMYPKEKIFLDFNVKYPGFYDIPYGVNMVFDYETIFHKKIVSPYERLLIDAMKGDQTLFPRQDGIEEMWDIVDPIIKYWNEKRWLSSNFYKSGSWGPKSSDKLMKEDKRIWKIY